MHAVQDKIHAMEEKMESLTNRVSKLEQEIDKRKAHSLSQELSLYRHALCSNLTSSMWAVKGAGSLISHLTLLWHVPIDIILTGTGLFGTSKSDQWKCNYIKIHPIKF